MPIQVHCEGCGKTYKVRDDMAGKTGKCPAGHVISVPAAVATAGSAGAATPPPLPKILPFPAPTPADGPTRSSPLAVSSGLPMVTPPAMSQPASAAGSLAPWWIGGGIVALMIAAVGGWYFFLRGGESSEPVSPPPFPTTRSSEIEVAVAGVMTHPTQFMELSNIPTQRHSLSANEGSKLVLVKFLITPQKGGKLSLSDGASILHILADSVYRDGDWLFINPFAQLQCPEKGADWHISAAVIDKHTSTIAGEGKAKENFAVNSATANMADVVLCARSLAVGKKSMVTCAFAIPADAKSGILRIRGCSDLTIDLNDWGDWK